MTTGFTAVETMVAISVFTLITTSVVASVIAFYDANLFNFEQAVAVNSGRKGVERMVRDIKEANFSDEGAYALIEFASTSLTFYSDIDRDDSVERIRFFLDGSDFKRGLTESTSTPPEYDVGTEVVSTVAEYVNNVPEGTPIFTYFDENNVEITNNEDINDIARINVELVVNVNPQLLPNEFTLLSSAKMRNVNRID